MLLLFLLEVIVINLDSAHDEAARSGDKVSNEQCPENVRLVEYALQHEAQASYTHHQEGGQGNAIGVACLDGFNGLRQIAQYHADAGYPAANFKQGVRFHRLECLFFSLQR